VQSKIYIQDAFRLTEVLRTPFLILFTALWITTGFSNVLLWQLFNCTANHTKYKYIQRANIRRETLSTMWVNIRAN